MKEGGVFHTIPAAKAEALDLDSLPCEFFTADDFEDDGVEHPPHEDYLYILYSSPLFKREWQNLIGQGWTTITVEAWIDGDHGNISHVCGAIVPDGGVGLVRAVTRSSRTSRIGSWRTWMHR